MAEKQKQLGAVEVPFLVTLLVVIFPQLLQREELTMGYMSFRGSSLLCDYYKPPAVTRHKLFSNFVGYRL